MILLLRLRRVLVVELRRVVKRILLLTVHCDGRLGLAVGFIELDRLDGAWAGQGCRSCLRFLPGDGSAFCAEQHVWAGRSPYRERRLEQVPAGDLRS